MSEYQKMDADAKAKWIAALRSGNYKQGGLLVDWWAHNPSTRSHCCLGVLCVVQGEQMLFDEDGIASGFNLEIVAGEPKKFENAFVPIGYCGLLKDAIDRCVHMNDNEGMSFAQIADFIEENF